MAWCLKLQYYFWQLVSYNPFVVFSSLSRNWNENILLLLLFLGTTCQHGPRLMQKTQNMWYVALYFSFIKEIIWGEGLFT